MDLGNDAELAARYASEHASADRFVTSGAAGLSGILTRVRQARSILSHPISYLVDHGYTPSFLVASGISWSSLQKKYGAEALMNMGFMWSHMRSSGISGSEACAIGMERLGISADEMMEVRPTIDDIAGMRMPLCKLKQYGFTMEKLQALGLDCKSMRSFGTSLSAWQQAYELDSATWNKLGFADVKCAQRLGWCPTDMHAVGMFGARRRDSTTTRSGGWQF